MAGKRMAAIISDMGSPLGYAVGNSLEIIEVMETLKGYGPKDLVEIAMVLAGGMIYLGGKADSFEEGKKMAEVAIENGQALEKFRELGVHYFTVYAFSTENWKRPAEEVGAIMGLLDRYLRKAIGEMTEKNIRLCFFGDLAPLSDSLKQLIHETNEISCHTTGMQVNVCLNYGGRAEIVRAARLLAQECAEGKLSPEDITETALSQKLYSANIPDPDLMIRPGGELRLSNFLLWQNAYTEFYFTDTLWSDMDETELDRAIAAYQSRKRRYGGISL